MWLAGAPPNTYPTVPAVMLVIGGVVRIMAALSAKTETALALATSRGPNIAQAMVGGSEFALDFVGNRSKPGMPSRYFLRKCAYQLP